MGVILVSHSKGRTLIESENGVLSGTGSNRRSKTHGEELHKLCYSAKLIRMMKWAGYVAHTEDIYAYKILIGKPQDSMDLICNTQM
jgi:hypothetical protein